MTIEAIIPGIVTKTRKNGRRMCSTITVRQATDVPKAVEDWVAELKLGSMGIRIDKLSKEQQTYLTSWNVGT